MRLRAAPGELALGLAFAAIGLFWAASALRLDLWDGSAPGTGFLPLIYGVLLTGLAAGALLFESSSADAASDESGVMRPALVVLALAVAVAGVETAGFAFSIFVLMFFLYKIAEKLPLLPSLLTAAGTAAVLTLIFRTWLSVPLPKGPWGF